jgi:small-conductance mechanosensitive channel
MEWMTRPFATLGRTEISALSVAEFLVVVVAVVVAARLVGQLVGSRLFARTAMDPGLQYATGRITYYVLLVIGVMIALHTVGIEMGTLVVVFGALGLGIGFGLQNVVTNFAGGLILLIERPISIGDRIEVGGMGGRVERIGTRSTTILTNDNIAMIVPNAEFVSERIINWSHGDPRVRYRIRVGVAYGSDMDQVRQALLEAAASHPSVLPDPAPTVFFDEFGDSSLNMELAVWTRELAQNPRRLRSELNFAVDGAFRRHGVTIPFPQRDLHFRSGRLPVAEAPGFARS